MIKLKNILTESGHGLTDESIKRFDEFTDYINDNGFIRTNPIIYRGIQGNKRPQYYDTYTIRTDRYGRDSEDFSNEVMNTYLEESTSLPLRSEILFCTLDITFAESYGQTHVILPHKDNILYAYPDDSYLALDQIDAFYNRLTSNKTDVIKSLKMANYENYLHVYELIQFILDKRTDISSVEYLIDNMNEIGEESFKLGKVLRDIDDSSQLTIHMLNSGIETMQEYPNQAVKIKNVSAMDYIENFEGKEIWISHGKYCTVNELFYKNYKAYINQ